LLGAGDRWNCIGVAKLARETGVTQSLDETLSVPQLFGLLIFIFNWRKFR
jgi:hypothetical protein